MPKTLRSAEHHRLILRLSDARKAKGMTQAELASVIGRPQSFIAKVEGGERRLEVLEFAHLARVLDLNPGKLLNEVVGS
jgi:transcriptional regulator with XRE-family HTH domain